MSKTLEDAMLPSVMMPRLNRAVMIEVKRLF
jgi:hypothetical protein